MIDNTIDRPAGYQGRHRMAPWYVRLAAWVMIRAGVSQFITR